MATFVLTELVRDPLDRVETWVLGVDANNKFASADVGKAVTMGTANNMVPVAAGNEIMGFVSSVEPATINSGFSYGGVKRNGRMTVQVGASQVGAIAIGDLVVADTPVALGTAGLAAVQDGAPADDKWRIIRILTGTGVTGDQVLIEKV